VPSLPLGRPVGLLIGADTALCMLRRDGITRISVP
jgi:hypothetical protein